MNYKYFKISVTTLAITFFACNQEPPLPTYPYEPEIYVFALLMLNNQQKTVRIERTFKASDYMPAERGITDATVIIGTDDEKVIMSHRENGAYFDKYRQLTLKAGETYYLDITLDDGHKISATCLMPDKPKIRKPQHQEYVQAYHFLDIEWDKVPQVCRYAVYVTGNISGFSTHVRTDTSATTIYPFLFAQPDNYVIKTVALDHNYYDYIIGDKNDDPILHIQGSLGVFGAIAYDEVVVTAK